MSLNLPIFSSTQIFKLTGELTPVFLFAILKLFAIFVDIDFNFDYTVFTLKHWGHITIQALLNIEIEETCCELTTQQIEDLINSGDDSIDFDFQNNDVIQYDSFNNVKLLGKFSFGINTINATSKPLKELSK